MTSINRSPHTDDTDGMATSDLAVRLLRRLALFADLDDDELVTVARILRPRAVAKGAMILAQDEPGNVAFIILQGAVHVLLEAEDGRQFIVARLTPGDHFGEMSLLDAEPRSASVVAAEDTSLLVIRRDEFLEELVRYPRVALRLLQTLSRRLRRADAQVASLAFGDTAARLARLLIANASPGPYGLGVEVAQEDLAQMIGATRQTVGRIFSDWRARRFIETGRRRTAILNPDALRQEARL